VLTYGTLAFRNVAAVCAIDVSAIVALQAIYILEMVSALHAERAVTLLMVRINVIDFCCLGITRTKSNGHERVPG
jgi:hypothetical protein